MVYSTRRFVLSLTLCYFVLEFFSPFRIAITLLGEERANLSAFCTFVWFVLVWFCWFPFPLGVWEGLRFVIVALPGFFSYLLPPKIPDIRFYLHFLRSGLHVWAWWTKLAYQVMLNIRGGLITPFILGPMCLVWTFWFVIRQRIYKFGLWLGYHDRNYFEKKNVCYFTISQIFSAP